MTASIGWSGDHEVLDFLDDAGKRLGRHSPVTATGSSPELWSATLISQRQKRLPDAIAAAFLPLHGLRTIYKVSFNDCPNTRSLREVVIVSW